MTNVCSPNEDFGRRNKRSVVSPHAESTFQGCENRIWASTPQTVCSTVQNLRLGSIKCEYQAYLKLHVALH